MYDLAGYGRMISDAVRRAAYERALARHVTPDTVVIDVGCGAGHFAMVAARLGARHVFAVEPDPQTARNRSVDGPTALVRSRRQHRGVCGVVQAVHDSRTACEVA